MLLLVALLPASAGAAQRWAAATSTTDTGTCSADRPCSLLYAVDGAADGDEVIVTGGVYKLVEELAPAADVDLHGVPGEPRPRVVGASPTGAAVLTMRGGSVRHLAIEAAGAGQDALNMRGGLAEDLLLLSASGDGAKLVATRDGTLLRDSVVRSTATGSGNSALRLREFKNAPGQLKVLNVTAMASDGNASGILCDIEESRATVVNSIVRGARTDIASKDDEGRCVFSASNFRTAQSPKVVAGLGNQEAEPRFADAANGDFRPLAGSPTVDAGMPDAMLGTMDPAGCPRRLGGGPDIGAYEQAAADACGSIAAEPAVATVPPAKPDLVAAQLIEDTLRGVPAPVLGSTVVVAPGNGRVRVRRPGRADFEPLDRASRLPVGSVVDARSGRARLISAVDTAVGLQTGTFWGTRFEVRQAPGGNGMTDLVLRGGSFRGRCRVTATASRATGPLSRRVVRTLWASDRHGRFRTHGHDSVATARGTSWVTQDRCDGTLTRVTAGTVAVRPRGHGRTVLVRAGRAYLARSAR